MDTADQQALIEKIEALPPTLQERVEGYVDALLEEAGRGDGHGRSGDEGDREEEREGDEEYLDLNFRGALKRLRDQYTSVELQHELRDEWRKQIDDS